MSIARANIFPKWVLLNERTSTVLGSERFRYGYQGSEKDNEVKGEGNSYTTFYRQLDPRLGRWLSIDPVLQPWQSPYCSMDNNPIIYNDILGNVVKPQSEKSAKAYNDYRNVVKERITNLEGSISNTKNTRKKERLTRELNEVRQVDNDLNALEKSSDVYRIRVGSDEYASETMPDDANLDLGGLTAFNLNTLEIDITIKDKHHLFSQMDMLSHELAHGSQFEKGEINFNQGRYGGYAYDVTDEKDAFRVQNLFSKNIFDAETELTESYGNRKQERTMVQAPDAEDISSGYTTGQINYHLGLIGRSMTKTVNAGDAPAHKAGQQQMVNNLQKNIQWQISH